MRYVPEPCGYTNLTFRRQITLDFLLFAHTQCGHEIIDVVVWKGSPIFKNAEKAIGAFEGCALVRPSRQTEFRDSLAICSNSYTLHTTNAVFKM
ncbi:hypothetical protein HBI56_153920 [Parastagonospora nodorum]|uniref:Uncharacterized protein n=1 Tax=Phaeosphaeria nodorum (strain SN15 / ATCC MYA-4574 / FGSC 10173) TaxID=321614 RepID=A0A7U2FH25_PHANO|nr:hypothetical protein HBH56_116580 [Parastagonospora nodorum]QRD05131.1 hypothetical protein JI435_422050 [Parastagonospora nodorum SN15]KAH3928804.1 hypothetical protein HBH54_132600 [Parastagonospora nodorum]KAH3950518.1 hypothetical protein HBH53_072860 [Parastagonospora nodorum]KAH3965825.1 hypothetical protein HBH51_148880 [Parastagonospora nodorum]